MVGYGESCSAGVGRDISVVAQAHYLVQWLDAIEVERAILVGHDLGGGVAQIVAVEHPDRCEALVLINSIGYDSWPVPSVKLMQRAAPVLERAPRAFVRAASTRRDRSRRATATTDRVPCGGRLGRRGPVPEARVRTPARTRLGAQIDEIDGGKHFVPEDRPDRAAGAITSLRERVSRA